MDYDEIRNQLSSSGANLRCNDLQSLLEAAGFNVRRGNGNHYVFTHDGIDGFTSGSFNGGHGSNPQIKRPYVKKILKIFTDYEDGLRKFMEKQDE